MALRLKQHESVGAGLKRIMRRHMDKALLVAGQRRPSHNAAHDLRVNLKKLRADLRLLRTQLGKKRYRRENQRFRNAVRPLTEVRDAQILVETLDKLGSKHYAAIRAVLQQRYLATRRRVLEEQGALRHVVHIIEEAQQAPWAVKDLQGAALIKSLGHTYSKAHHAFKIVRKQPYIAHLHEWRKQSKYLWYQLLLLKAAWPSQVKKWDRQFQTLTDLLGDDHDLAVLRQALLHGHFPKTQLRLLLPRIDTRRQRLQEKALKLGEKLYRKKPDDFARRIGAHWKAWRR